MSGVTGVDVEHTKALTDAEIDADLVGDGGMYFEPDAGYPEYGNDTVRWAYRLGHEAGGAELPALVAAVERVQALHTPDEFGMCEGCGDNEHGYAIVPHPCPTIRELEIK